MPFRLLLVGGSPTDFHWNSNMDAASDFETGAEAQAFAKRLMAANPESKWRVKRVLDTKWKSREQRKFDIGFYQYLPWIGERWWCTHTAVAVHSLHYPHVSRKQPGMMAYTESVDKGMDNKQTQIKAGRYLEKYFGEYAKLHGLDIAWYAKNFEEQYAPRPVFFTDDPVKIQWVYETGPHSCMSSASYRAKHGWGYPGPGEWPEKTHACRVYAAGDLQLAYLTNNNKPDGKVSARCVVWPENNTMSRAYGDETALQRQLLGMGYKQEPPIGAKLLRIPVKNTKAFLLPYIDRGHRSGTGSVCVLDKKTHFIICEASTPLSYSANNTSGLSGRQYDKNGRIRENSDVPPNCQRCENHSDDVGDLGRVWRSGNPTDGQFWCAACTNDYAYLCSYSGQYYSSANVSPVTMADGVIWADLNFRTHGFKCDATGALLPNRRKLIMYNRKRWDIDYAKDHAFQCTWSGDWYPIDMMIKIKGGAKVANTMFEHSGFTCAECEGKFMQRMDVDYSRGTTFHCDKCELKLQKRNQPELGLEERA